MSEDRLQMSVIEYLELAKPSAYYFHVPNASMATPSHRRKLKLMGLKAGVADLLFILPGGRLGAIEIKTHKGRQSEPQKGFESICLIYDVDYRIARSIDEVANILREWKCL